MATTLDQQKTPPATERLSAELSEAREEIESLQRAIESRYGIGLAQGYLMGSQGLSDGEALEHLVAVAQELDIGVGDAARHFLTEVGVTVWVADSLALGPDGDPRD
jgi:AmiR/NasT family two-component response regulator